MDRVTLDAIFTAIDAKDADGVARFLTEDALFRYGGQPEVRGRAAIRDYVAGFFGALASIRHRNLDSWTAGDGTMFVQGEVAYTFPDGSKQTIPFLDLWRLEGERIREYLVYLDTAAPFLKP